MAMIRRRRPFAFATLALLGSATAGACGGPEAEVEVRTYVGDTFERRDPALQREAWLEVFRTVAPNLWKMPTLLEPGTPRSLLASTSHPPRSAKDFDALVRELRTGPIEELAGPARRLSKASSAVWPQLHASLLEERRAPKADYRSVLSVIGGDVPNRYGHFALSWKKAHGHDVKLSEDWFEDLLAVPAGRISTPLLDTYRDCVLQAALLRAASALGVAHPELTADIVETLLETAYAHRGIFRDEVSRSLSAIGDEAVPTLLIHAAAIDPDDPDATTTQEGRFARFILDKLDRAHPRRAIDAVRADPRRLTLLLEAYGKARMPEAAEVLLEFVDDRSPSVRRAARRAFEAYVTGDAPRARRRDVRLLGGATTTAKAYLTYRARAAIAVRERLEADHPSLVEDPCALFDAQGRLDPACESQPARHTVVYFEALDRVRAERHARVIAEALADPDPERGTQALNRLLAEHPTLQQREAVVDFFRARGRDLEAEDDRVGSAVQLRKAAMLADDAAAAARLHVAALLNEAQAPGLEFHGRQMLLRTALELAPDDARVRRAWRTLSDEVFVGPAPWIRWTQVLALLALSAIALAWMLKPLRRLLGIK